METCEVFSSRRTEHGSRVHGNTDRVKICSTTLCVRYTSLTATISHDNNNHRTSKHASTSWRSDGPPFCLGGSSHGWVPVKTHSTTRAHFGGEAVGCSPTPRHHINEPKKTQHNNNMVAEQLLCDLSVRRASVMRSLGAQNKCVPMECAEVPDVCNTVRSDGLSKVVSRAETL